MWHLVAVAVIELAWMLDSFGAQGQDKKVVKTAEDLPRLSYPLKQTPSELLQADEEGFRPFATKVEADVDAILKDYTIEDKATLRSLLGAKENAQLLRGDISGASATTARVRDLQEKPEAKLTSGLSQRAFDAAFQETRTTSGPAFLPSYRRHLSEALEALPWDRVQETIKALKSGDETMSHTANVGFVKYSLDPQFAKTGSLDLPGAQSLLVMRTLDRVYLPLVPTELSVLRPYLAAHTVQKPDIWAARDVTLTPDQKLTPVRIAVFDTGVDTSLYPGQLFVDPTPGAHSPHGLAFDMQGNLYNADLQPMTPEQKAEYPHFLALDQGFDDQQNGIDSPAAATARQTISRTPPDQLAALIKKWSFLNQYAHGTHVAGIAVRGNPAARLVVIQFNDALPDMPFPPTVAWAERFKADFRMAGEYLRDHDVRVVNMSWVDSQGEFEQWLTKTSSEKEPNVRKQLAAQLYAVWREAVEGAIRAAPKTLFVCAAGNSDSNPSFLGDVPASLQLPNLVTVGAVDQAGDETSFTSYGPTVLLDADGYEVESFVPGGTKLRLSGTSMASPNVVNLAAKLIALNPALTPERTIALMRQAASTSPDGRLHLVNSKATVALMRQQAAR